MSPTPMRLAALLRAVNVGGTGMLAMRDLAAICERAGFSAVRTYIQSGNVVFATRLTAEPARLALERALTAHTGTHIDVLVRTGPDLTRIVEANPFPDAPGARVAVVFSSVAVPASELRGLTGPAGELVVPAGHEVYVHYPDGQGRSKLKFPKIPGVQTVRNMNTVAKLAAMVNEG